MLETGEDLHFALKVALGSRREQARDQFDRDQLLHAIVSIGEVDHPHAPGTDGFPQAESTEDATAERLLGLARPTDQRAGLQAVLTRDREQCLDLRAQAGVMAALLS
jgi:hypothetical protein